MLHLCSAADAAPPAPNGTCLLAHSHSRLLRSQGRRLKDPSCVKLDLEEVLFDSDEMLQVNTIKHDIPDQSYAHRHVARQREEKHVAAHSAHNEASRWCDLLKF